MEISFPVFKNFECAIGDCSLSQYDMRVATQAKSSSGEAAGSLGTGLPQLVAIRTQNNQATCRVDITFIRDTKLLEFVPCHRARDSYGLTYAYVQGSVARVCTSREAHERCLFSRVLTLNVADEQ
jgi:hypothetical protein